MMDCAEPTLIEMVGINDIPDKVYDKISKGKYKAKPYYEAWRQMLTRTFNQGYIKKHPTYMHVQMCKEWLRLSNFKEWHDENYIKGWELDKDILSGEYKMYGPLTCAYVPPEVNAIYKSYPISKSGLPRGVFKNNKKYTARLRLHKGNSLSLGTYNTIKEANMAVNKAISQKKKTMADKYQHVLNNKVLNKLQGGL